MATKTATAKGFAVRCLHCGEEETVRLDVHDLHTFHCSSWGHLTKRTIKHGKPWELHAGKGQSHQSASRLSAWGALQSDVRPRAESCQIRGDFRLFGRELRDLSEFNLTGPGVSVLYSPFREVTPSCDAELSTDDVRAEMSRWAQLLTWIETAPEV